MPASINPPRQFLKEFVNNPTEDPTPAQKPVSQSFGDFGLSPAVMTALGRMGYQEPTEVQALAIPLAMPEMMVTPLPARSAASLEVA